MQEKVTLSHKYEPSEKEEYMNSNQLEYFKEKLSKWREELLKESSQTINHLKEENWNEPDLNDRACLETETTLELKTRSRYKKLINKIDYALKKIEKEDYGYCENTSKPIGLKRLMARPTATLCIEEQEKYEKYKKEHASDD